jgi:helicase required for RNAi-mediated heterochromatin assembly 1
LLIRRRLNRQNLWDIEQQFRGAVYEYWQRQLISRRRDELCIILANSTRISKNLKINRWAKDVQCIRAMHINIVGCTTTGLCKYRGLLAALKPKTILIEEAAQSREANITSALYPGLQQLILVGDDQQLVPHCDTPGLSDAPYNLRVSMFERLVRYLGLPFTFLNMQRRMIPNIREILNPFYHKLGDHPVVRDPDHRPPIPGMPAASYLFHHEWMEGMDMESLSKHNVQEAEMVVRFSAYLVFNGTPAEKITVLTFYRGQRKKIFQIARKYLPELGIRNLNVCTVDSYQGEENDIIILSLVRSNRPNTPGRAGFVEDMNRGVVSISRARRGFYIFGNITNLENATEQSAFMWGNVRQVFERQGRFDPTNRGLPIRCQNHGVLTYVENPEDLEGNMGGCWQPCGGRFEDCGHACKRICHP